MGNLVCVSGDFCSGSTLVFTLFRETGQYHCLYEPLHEHLREYLVYGLRAHEDSHHFFVGNYHRELRGFGDAGALFDPRWGTSCLYIPPDAPADRLYRYLSCIIDMSFERRSRVMLKENRLAFRLEWFRRRFPQAAIVHVHRSREGQWQSILRRVQAYHRREDVGQDSADFNGFGMARWCDDVAPIHPELERRHSRTGFERFSKLWALSFEEHRRHADVSIAYEDLLGDFESVMKRLWKAIDGPDVEFVRLRRLVVPRVRQDHFAAEAAKRPMAGARRWMDRALRRYAALRVRADDVWRSRGRLPADPLA